MRLPTQLVEGRALRGDRPTFGRAERVDVVPAHQGGIADEQRLQAAVLSPAAVTAVVEEPAGQRDRTHRHHVPAVVDHHPGVVHAAEGRGDLETIALPEDRAGGTEQRGVVDEGRAPFAVSDAVFRGKLLAVLGQELAGEGIEDQRLDLARKGDVARGHPHLEARGPAERVSDVGLHRAVRLPEQLGLLDVVAAGSGPVRERSRHVRDRLQLRPPRPPVGAILVTQRAANVLEAAVDLQDGAEVVVAEDVAEEERHSSAHVGPRGPGAHAERGLPDVVELDLGLVVRRLEGLGGGKAEGRLAVQGHDLRPRTLAGRERGRTHPFALVAEGPAGHPRSLDGVDPVLALLVQRCRRAGRVRPRATG